jgi:uncharacterized protein with ParB-like and HNH nuclease domain
MKKNYYYIPNTNLNVFEKITICKNNVSIKNFYFMFPYKFPILRFSKYDYYDIISLIDYKEFCNRLFCREGIFMERNFKTIINKEENSSYSDDDLFNITSWGADLTFRELIMMYDDKDLIKPTLQRNYVWKLDEASRLIDSILLGLPIPSIFLAKKNEQQLIIDGYQRIKTVYDYVKGIFSQNNKVFKLSNSIIINERWRGKAFSELSDDEQRRIKNTTIHAIIFEQKKPNNDTGMFQIFERINTSGRTLSSQEIRNCVYHGRFNDLLIELNKNTDWRELLNCKEDIRMLDMENILRFFAITDIENTDFYLKNQIILKKFLNEYMSQNSNIDDNQYEKLKSTFEKIMHIININLGSIAFNNLSFKNNPEEIYSEIYVPKFHPTIFEAVSAAFLYASKHLDFSTYNFSEIKDKHIKLLNNEEFKDAISTRTTKIENIKKRITLATEYLFDLNYEWK